MREASAEMWHSGPDGLVVLAALLLPERISALRDRQTLGTIHTVPLAEEDLTVREIALPEKLELLGRAILDPDLEVFSTTQSLPLPGEAWSGAGGGSLFPKCRISGRVGYSARELRPGHAGISVRQPGGLCAVRRLSIRQYAVLAGHHRQPGQLLDRGGRRNRPAGLDRLFPAFSPSKKLALGRSIGNTLFGWPKVGGAAAWTERVGN